MTGSVIQTYFSGKLNIVDVQLFLTFFGCVYFFIYILNPARYYYMIRVLASFWQIKEIIEFRSMKHVQKLHYFICILVVINIHIIQLNW